MLNRERGGKRGTERNRFLRFHARPIIDNNPQNGRPFPSSLVRSATGMLPFPASYRRRSFRILPLYPYYVALARNCNSPSTRACRNFDSDFLRRASNTRSNNHISYVSCPDDTTYQTRETFPSNEFLLCIRSMFFYFRSNFIKFSSFWSLSLFMATINQNQFYVIVEEQLTYPDCK